MKTKLHYVFSITLLLAFFSVNGQHNYWTSINYTKNSRSSNLKNLNQEHYKTFQLDVNTFKENLEGAPLRGDFSGKSNTIAVFPDEKGNLEQYRIVETPVLSKELSLLHPEIKTYLGFGIDSPGARIRFSVTPRGLKTMTSYLDKDMVLSQPINSDSNNNYLIYTRAAEKNIKKSFECLTEDIVIPETRNITSRDANDQTLKTLRIAISTTGEYTNSVEGGGSQASALAAVVATLNRTNEVFEVDMAITFTLVSGTSIIYENAASDPYTNDNNYNGEVQGVMNTFGNANYDIGHLFAFSSTTPGNGNAGCIGCVCVDGQKGSAFSSHPFNDNDGGPYMSDFFDIDYVPHEIGHQMGANHTWSFASEGTGVNYEPGSGTTIMAYAGITGVDDVQDHSDPYFHYASIDQILNYFAQPTVTCEVDSAISNEPPVANAGPDYSIPQGTAFVLKGAATDPNGADVLTYTWEQIDDGVTTNATFSPTKTSGALWRSRPPSSSTDRYMPILPRVIAGQLTESSPTETVDNTSWETVSTVARTLNFALTVRDRSEAGGIGQSPQSDFDTMAVNVINTTTPFSVTSPNTLVGWLQSTQETITWDVAGTDGGTINTANVNILLSTDGGLNFDTVLASNTPNDGSEIITVPNVTSLNCRIMVEAVGNIFYAVNSAEFAIGYNVTTSCNTYNSTDPALPLAIDDDGDDYTQVTTIPVPDTGIISDVNVFVDITHPYMGDLIVGVQSPDATLLNMVEPYSPCQNEDANLVTTFDDSGVAFDCNITGDNLVMQSQQDQLSSFNSKNSGGTWLLGVGDFGAADVGTLNNWSIEICTSEFTLATPIPNDSLEFSVIPNPSNGEFIVILPSTNRNDITLTIFDVRGRNIYEKKYSSSNGNDFKQVVSLRDVDSGIYLLNVSNGVLNETKKIVIE